MSLNARAHLLDLPPYEPVEPYDVVAARSGWPPQRLLKLDANENPYGPLPQVRAALAELAFPHIYPDPESRALRQALAEFTQVPAEYLLAGAGADELIDLLLRAILDPGDAVVICPPTFGMYAFDARINAARVIAVARRPDFGLDVEAIATAVESSQAKALLLATPNNPDGSLPSRAVLEALLALPTLVVLDEAYIEFVDDGGPWGARRSFIRQVPERENLVVLRTFSKWAGLAGLRVGYGAFPRWLAQVLWRIKQPYNVNVAAQVAALVTLQHREQWLPVVQRLQQVRRELFQRLQAMPGIEPYPSQTNFVLARITAAGLDGRTVRDRLLREHGVLVRYFDKPGLHDHIRISAGKPEDMPRLYQALEAVLQNPA